MKKYNTYSCFKSNWEDELIELETPNIQRKLNVAVISIRQLSPSWAEYRRHVIKQDTNESDSLREENHIEKLIIKGVRSMTTKEFEEM